MKQIVSVASLCSNHGSSNASVVLLCLPGVTADLWDQEIYPKWSILVLQEALELGDLFSQHVWGVADAANDTQPASVGNCGGELGAGCYVHTGEHYWVVDFEEVSDRCAELLWEHG